MDLQGMQSMVLTLGNGQVWLGAPPIELQFIFVFFHFVILQMSLREKHSFSFRHWENDRMLLTLSIERNPFPAKNQTLRSYRVYISPTMSACSKYCSILVVVQSGLWSQWWKEWFIVHFTFQ